MATNVYFCTSRIYFDSEPSEYHGFYVSTTTGSFEKTWQKGNLADFVGQISRLIDETSKELGRKVDSRAVMLALMEIEDADYFAEAIDAEAAETALEHPLAQKLRRLQDEGTSYDE